LSRVDSTTVNPQGNFMFELNDTLQQGVYKIGLDQKNAASIVLSGEEEITIKADYGQLKADKITVTNSKENEAYRFLLNEWNRMAGRMVVLNIEKSQISTVDPLYIRKTKDIDNKVRLVLQEHNVNLLYLKETYPDTFMSEVLVSLSLLPQLSDYPDLSDSYDNERAFMHDYFFEFIDFGDERIIYNPFLAKKYFTYMDQYTHHTAEGFKDSADLILSKANENNTVREFTIQFLIDIFNERGPAELADYVVDNYVEGCGKPLSERTVEKIEKFKRLRVGQIAPEIVSKDADGNTITLSSLIRKNDVLMVYFWAPWCEGCEAENPDIVRLYNKFKERGLDIYAVALDSDETKWLKAIKKHRFSWTNVSDLREWESEAVKAYNVNKTPTIYLLDKKGMIMAKNLRGRELEIKVEGLLN
jgi:peroxiredoxin